MKCFRSVLWSFIVVICCIEHCHGFGPNETFILGGLFDKNTEHQEQAFRLAAEVINSMDWFSGKFLTPHNLVTESEVIPLNNPYQASQAVCRFLKMGVVAVFGPSSVTSANYVQSVSDIMDLPHLQAKRDAAPTRGACMLNLYPYPPVLAKVYVDLVRAFKWKSFTILYENSLGLPRINELLKVYDTKGYTVTVRRLDGGADYREVLRIAQKSGDRYFILECSISNLDQILREAQQVGLVTDNFHFLITSLDMHTLDLTPYQYAGANITGVRMLNPDDPDVQQHYQMWQDLELQKGRALNEGLTPHKLQLETALLYDAVFMFAKTLHNGIKPQILDCDNLEYGQQGFSLISFMKTMHHKGLTGVIKFDQQEFRTDFMLDVTELRNTGLHKIGTWNSTEGLKLNRSPGSSGVKQTLNLHNRTLVVLTALANPYGMLKDSANKLTGNDRFEGFGIDLIHEMSLMLGFNYTFVIQEDGVYGSLNKETKEWNGMIRKLQDGEADLAVTDLTITSERESGADFTMPFMNLGVSILYKKPTKMPPELFSFMAPFSSEVWFYLGVSTLGVSFLLFVMGRISPYEWTNPYPCVEEPEVLLNQFSFANSIWFCIGSLLQQGSEIAPIATSTRMVAGIWWFFTLIMVSSYTANLAAFLTVESLSTPIKNAEDLGNQHTIEYGAKRGGSTAGFFVDSNYSTYNRMGQYMTSHPHVMTGTNEEGLDRVKNSNYAFLMESTSIQYIIERECDLAQVGGLLDDKGYGVAMKKDSEFRHVMSTAILQLQAGGKLHQMKDKWWKEKRGGGACSTDDGGGEAEELGLPNVGGVFVVVVVGFIGSALIAFMEMMFGAVGRSFEYKIPLREELAKELKFFIRCTGLTKPTRTHSEEHDDEEDGDGVSHKSNEDRKDFKEFMPNSYGFAPDVTKDIFDAVSRPVSLLTIPPKR